MLPKLPKKYPIRLLLVEVITRLWQSSTQRVMSITALGMTLALAADILVAAKLGATTLTDTLIIALTVPRIIEVVVREGTKFSLVSLLIEIEQKNAKIELFTFVSMLFNLGLVLGSLIMLCGWVFATPIIQLTGPGLSEPATTQAIFLFRISLPLALFAILSTVLSVFLNSQKHFTVTAARNMSMPTAIIVLIALNWQNSEVVSWIAAGHAIGYFCYFIYLLVYSFMKTDFRFDWRAWPNRKVIAQLNEAVLYPSFGLAVRQSLRIAEGALASLIAPGGVASYYFAYRLISSLQTIIGVSFATTKLPEMSRQAARQDKRKYEKSLSSQIWQVSMISLPISLFVLLFHTQIIQLLYGRGSFTVDSVAQTSQVLQVLGFNILFLSLIPTLNAALYALQKYKLVWWNQVLNTATNLVLAWYLSKLYGIAGIAIALVLATIASVIVQSFMLYYNRIVQPIKEV